jgi:hypothetical protein
VVRGGGVRCDHGDRRRLRWFVLYEFLDHVEAVRDNHDSCLDLVDCQRLWSPDA